MDEVGHWLEQLGLGRYAATFAENDIEFDLLSELTNADLEKIGVSSLGHRKKLLKAIAALSGETAAPVDTTLAKAESESPPQASSDADLLAVPVLVHAAAADGEGLDPTAVQLVVSELTLEAVAVGKGKDPAAVGLAVFHLALVAVAVGPGDQPPLSGPL